MRARRRVAVVLSAALVLILAPSGRSLGSPQVAWHATLGGSLDASAFGPHGEIYVTGARDEGSTLGGPMLLARLTPAGEVLWTRSWRPDPSRPDRFSTAGTAVDVGADGVVYVGGYVQRYNCEGGGWFVRAYSPGGRLRGSFTTKRAWNCKTRPESFSDLIVQDDQVIVAGSDYMCCGGSGWFKGWVRAFDRRLRGTWKTAFEPGPPIPRGYIDRAESLGAASSGAIFVGGWAATEAFGGDGSSPDRTVVVQKLTATGGVVWARRLGRVDPAARVTIAVQGARVMLAVPIEGGGGWLARLDAGGALVSSRIWGRGPGPGPAPSDLAIDREGSTWIIEDRPDPDGGRNVVLRHYAPSMRFLGTVPLPAAGRWMRAGGVAVGVASVVATGATSTWSGWRNDGGHAWRIGW
jgi:hypothetical protein